MVGSGWPGLAAAGGPRCRRRRATGWWKPGDGAIGLAWPPRPSQSVTGRSWSAGPTSSGSSAPAHRSLWRRSWPNCRSSSRPLHSSTRRTRQAPRGA